MILNKKFNFDITVKIIFTGIILLALFFLIKYLSPVLTPFICSLFLLYFLNPLVEFFEKIIKSRTLAVWITIFLFLTFMILFIMFLIPNIKKELLEVHDIIIKIANTDNVIDEKISGNALISFYLNKLKTYITNNSTLIYFFNEENLKNITLELSKKLFPTLMTLFIGTANFFIWIAEIFIILVYLFFMLFGYKKIKEDFINLFPMKIKKNILNFLYTFNNAMNSYFKGQFLVAFFVGILFTTCFLIIKLPMAIILGIFFGFLNIIPYMQIFGFIPAIFLSIIKSIQSGVMLWQTILYTLIVILIVQTLQELILVPKIIGKKMKINPIMIILSLSIWGKLFGFFGFLIAIPISCLSLEYYKKLINKYEKGENL